jgi:hypothetical protein
VRCRITPLGRGGVVGFPLDHEVGPVEALPPMPVKGLRAEWVSGDRGDFRVVTYNLLADLYATQTKVSATRPSRR